MYKKKMTFALFLEFSPFNNSTRFLLNVLSNKMQAYLLFMTPIHWSKERNSVCIPVVKAKYISTYVEVDEVIMVVSVFEWTLESENPI